MNTRRLTPWWHPITLENGRSWHSLIGSLGIYLYRGPDEWQLAWEQFPDREEYYQVISSAIDALPSALKTRRYVFKQSPDTFCLKPALLDRPVVVKAHQLVHVPPGETIVFYISSPVCVRVELTQPALPSLLLGEIPALRISDTWFGPSTREGELCYATRTHARNTREDVPLRPHRAVTPVTIHNKSGQLLTIDKLSIPVPYLSIYGLEDGTLWTDPISLEHTDSHHLARLVIGKKPPGNKAVHLAEPRLGTYKANLGRVFSNMFSDSR